MGSCVVVAHVFVPQWDHLLLKCIMKPFDLSNYILISSEQGTLDRNGKGITLL